MHGLPPPNLPRMIHVMSHSKLRPTVVSLAILLTAIAAPCLSVAAELDWIRVADDGRSFIESASGKQFVPWGVNYDHDETGGGRLLEDYWETEWDTVEADFREIKELGAN